MASSSSSTPTPQEFAPPRPSFMEYPLPNDNEGTQTRNKRQSRGSITGILRAHDRQESSASIAASGTNIPNPFASPILGPTNPLSPPASLLSFNIGDAIGASTGFDAHHRASAHSSMANSAVDLQNRQSVVTYREPFSSPRPLTSIYTTGQPIPRSRLARRKSRPISTMLSGEITKPWLGTKDKAARISYLLTWSMFLLGIILSCIRCFFGWKNVDLIGKTCLVFEDDFSGSDIDSNSWTHEVDLGGFG